MKKKLEFIEFGRQSCECYVLEGVTKINNCRYIYIEWIAYLITDIKDNVQNSTFPWEEQWN